jgi:methyl-accepting chemotaxis protein
MKNLNFMRYFRVLLGIIRISAWRQYNPLDSFQSGVLVYFYIQSWCLIILNQKFYNQARRPADFWFKGWPMKMDKFKVAQRIVGGQALLLLIVVIIAGASVLALRGISADFGEFRRNVRNSNTVSAIDANIAHARLSVKDFLLTGDEQEAMRARTAIGEAEKLQAEASQNVVNLERRKILAEIGENLRAYEAIFTDVFNQDQEMDRLSREVLDKVGPSARTALTALINSAGAENDGRIALSAGRVMQDYMLVRFYLQRLEAKRDVQTATTLDEEFNALVSSLKVLRELAQAPARRASVNEIAQAIDTYVQAARRKQQLLLSMEKLSSEKLDPTGDKISELTANVRASMATRQKQLEPQVVATISKSELTSTVLGVLAVVLGVVVSWLVARSITGPVGALTGTMRRLADGDLEVGVPFAGDRDEMGEMARAVEVFKTNGLERRRLEAEQAAQREARERRALRLEQLMNSFDNQVQSLVGQLGAASTQMRASAQSMSALSEQTESQSITVAGAAEQASANVQAVASATEELSASLEEITRRVAESAAVTREAYDKATETNRTVASLSEAAGRIGTVVQLIQDIAGQTNLLALNATIEAARAGEAGKGFAVVASEVKTLATQTARATEEIGGQVQQVQAATRDAVAAIQGITSTISRVNEIAAAIAAAIEEQGAATQEIARNVQQAAVGTHDVSSTIVCVRAAAGETGAAATQVLGAASNVQAQSNQLTGVVSSFLEDVKAA